MLREMFRDFDMHQRQSGRVQNMSTSSESASAPLPPETSCPKKRCPIDNLTQPKKSLLNRACQTLELTSIQLLFRPTLTRSWPSPS